MMLIKHIIYVDLNDEQILIINSLNGLIDRIEKSTYGIMKKWSDVDNITPENNIEVILLNNLKERDYVVNSRDEEVAIRASIINTMRTAHNNSKDIHKYAIFILTYECNFRCHYCFEEGLEHNKSVISFKQIDAAFNLLGDQLEHICLFGGEPLLPITRSSIEYIVSKAPEKTYEIYTNGYYLLEYFDILARLKISKITVTLDGDESTHNKRRYLADGGPTFNKIIKGIDKYLQNGININIRINVDTNNIEESSLLKNKLFDRYKEYNMHLSFEVAPMLGSTEDERDKLLSELYNDDIKLPAELKQQHNRLIRRNDKSLFSVITSKSNQLKPNYCYCSAHDSNIAFDPHGNIYSCLLAVGNENLAVGTYYPEVKYKERSMYTRNIESIEKCNECIYAFLCGGGCVMSLSNYDDIFKPACKPTYNQIHNLLPQLYQMKLEHDI